jgi:hypothetical protein
MTPNDDMHTSVVPSGANSDADPARLQVVLNPVLDPISADSNANLARL